MHCWDVLSVLYQMLECNFSILVPQRQDSGKEALLTVKEAAGYSSLRGTGQCRVTLAKGPFEGESF